MQNNRLTYHFQQLIEELKAQISEEVATSVIKALGELSHTKAAQQVDQYLTSDEVADLFKISKSQLFKLRKKHKRNFPVHKFGSAVRYNRRELESFFKNLKS